MNRGGGGFRGGGGGFTRPENALKRAEELITVGQSAAALQVLSDVATSKKHRTWTQNHEQIMLKLVDLCVEARKRNQLKEALMQYRNVTQGVNVGSLELVVRRLLESATKRAEDACALAEAQAAEAEGAKPAEEGGEAEGAKPEGAKADDGETAAAAAPLVVAAAIGDLEADASPEDIMLSYVSGDKSRDRTDRELVTPWFRFLWESYRSVLEILRTNPKLESLYAAAARHAFAFCLKYKRTAEFRRLCDVLRQHLANMARYRDARELTAPEPLNLHLETRFEQLRVACELGLWAEAFRSVEDIQALLALGGAAPGGGALPGVKAPPGGRIAAPRPALMSVYYARLTQIFAVSEAHLYQAFAWLKLFTFSRAHRAKDLAADDARALATGVALAALSVLPYERQLFVGRPADEQAAEQERERALRIANILGLNVDAAAMAAAAAAGKRGGGVGGAAGGGGGGPVDPRALLSRGQLLASVQALNVLSLVPPEVRAAYDLLTSDDASPLDLCAQLAPLLEQISALSVQTSPACPVASPDFGAYVKHLRDVAVVRTLKQLSSLYSAMRVADLAALVAPVLPEFGAVEALAADAVRSGYLQARVDHRRGTVSFGSASLDSDGLRAHLAELARRLSRAALLIDPQEGARPRNAEERRLAAVRQAREQVEGEHKRALARKQVIEKRKEQQEAALLEQEREEEKRRLQAAREQELLEERRRKEEAARREKERLERELEEQEMAEARQLLEQAAAKKRLMGGKSAAAALRAGLPGADAGEDGVKLDKKALMQEALSERLREAQELERKIARAAKTMDHLERARREEEAPLVEAAYAARAEEDAALHAEQQAQLLEAHRAAWEADVKEKARLAAMAADKDDFAAGIVAKRQEQFEALREERARRLEERRAALKVEREVARRREFVTRCRKEVEARLAELEAERKAQEDARRKAELAERQKKLEEAAAKQRAREEEIEARARAEKEAVLSGRAPTLSSSSAGPAAAAGGGAAAASRAPGAFVPPALRRAQEAAAAGGGGGGVAPAAAAAAAAGPAAGGRPAFVPPARRQQEEAGGGGGGAPPPTPAAERPAPAPAAPAAGGGGGGGGGKFVPSALRRQQPPPPASGGDDDGGGARRW